MRQQTQTGLVALAVLALLGQQINASPHQQPHSQGSFEEFTDGAMDVLQGSLFDLREGAASQAMRLNRLPALINSRLASSEIVSRLRDMGKLPLDLLHDELSAIKFEGDDDPDIHRNISEIIRSRGFKAEEHDVTTSDGYIITIQRIVNPLIEPSLRPKLKPVLLQHGLFSSAADWVINSVDVRPQQWPALEPASADEFASDETNEILPRLNRDRRTINLDDTEGADSSRQNDSQKHPNSLGFYLANEGFDPWLVTIRGNTYGQRHISMSAWDPRFWAFSFDEHIKYDLPAMIKFVQAKTNQTKVGYVGHSQGTLMGFGLLADMPEYADVIEPFIALAPVAFVDHATTPARYFKYYTPVGQHMNIWFGTSNAAVKYLMPIVCGPKVIRREICSNILFLTTGFDYDELPLERLSAIVHHTPAGTSMKNLAHYGQELFSKRFAHFDHGVVGNLMKYGSVKNPDYNLANIKSKSIALFVAQNDWLADPRDVQRLVDGMKVEPYKVFNATSVKPKYNHIDFLYGKSCGEVINTHVVAVINQFRKY